MHFYFLSLDLTLTLSPLPGRKRKQACIAFLLTWNSLFQRHGIFLQGLEFIMRDAHATPWRMSLFNARKLLFFFKLSTVEITTLTKRLKMTDLPLTITNLYYAYQTPSFVTKSHLDIPLKTKSGRHRTSLSSICIQRTKKPGQGIPIVLGKQPRFWLPIITWLLCRFI